MDIWGPASVRTLNHHEYSQTIINGGTHWLFSPLLKAKSEAFSQYVILQTRLKTQYDVTFKVFHSDRGGEFLGDEFTAYLEQMGTHCSLTIHDTLEHNGTAE